MEGEGRVQRADERIDVVLEGLVGGEQIHSEEGLRNAHEAEGEDHGEYVVEEEEDDVRAAFLSHLDPRDQRHDAEDGEEEEHVEIDVRRLHTHHERAERDSEHENHGDSKQKQQNPKIVGELQSRVNPLRNHNFDR